MKYGRWFTNSIQQRQHAIPNGKAPKTPLYSLVQRASGATRCLQLSVSTEKERAGIRAKPIKLKGKI
jgi:hypothetical protein